MSDLARDIETTAIAFRGYNVTNLGRSAELLADDRYGPVVAEWLMQASDCCATETGRTVDLAHDIRSGAEYDLTRYPEAVALILAMELAQLDLLKQFHGVDVHAAKLSYGYSLGEIAALVASGVLPFRAALRIPLAMSGDCASLASDVTLGVLFSRGPEIDINVVSQLCLEINAMGEGTIGISTILAPNSILLFGQRDTVDRFGKEMHDRFPDKVHLRKNGHRWPPLHSPLVWQCNIPNRAAVMMHTLPVSKNLPSPPIFSLVSGKCDYSPVKTRELLTRWVDHPQRLWDAVCETLVQNVQKVIHVGPSPNLIPATFTRLSDNVKAQLSGRTFDGMKLRAVARAVRRPWLAKMLPSRSSLLRAPEIRHVILEDWLLEHR